MVPLAALKTSEDSFAVWVEERLSADGWRVFTEVPLMSRRIDIVALDSAGRVLAVELKLTDWRKAVAQAVEHRIACDGVAVCMPRTSVPSAAFEVMDQEGVAFIGVELESGALVLPNRLWHSHPRWRVAEAWLEKALESRGWAQ